MVKSKTKRAFTRLKANSTQAGMNRMHRLTRVHSQGLPVTNQPITSKKNVAGSTRLRRRLSTIFHQEMSEIGFSTRAANSFRTSGNNQLTICQSPRSQRCFRRLKAL